jgi:hypothetical protein
LGQRGLPLALEPFPSSAIPDVATAVKLLRRTEVANVGLLIDVWHFYNAGGRLDEPLPGGAAAVQLNDGPRVDRDYLRHARSARRLPGQGELDWTPEGGLGQMFTMMRPFLPPPPPDAGNSFEWGREEVVRKHRREQFHQTSVEFFDSRYRSDNEISHTREDLLALGTRR